MLTISSILRAKVSIGEMLRETDESDTFRYKRGHRKRKDFVDYLLFSATVGLICSASYLVVIRREVMRPSSSSSENNA